MKCKNCGADLKWDAKKKETYCPFCGSNGTTTVSDDVFIARMKNDLDRERLKAEKHMNRTRFRDLSPKAQSKILTIIIIVVLYLLLHTIPTWEQNFFQSVKKTSASEATQRQETLPERIRTPASAEQYLGRQYEEVAQELRDAGFKTVSTAGMNDLSDWLFFSKKDEVGKVGRVSIRGETEFDKGAWFRENDPVIVYYHSYPDSVDN